MMPFHPDFTTSTTVMNVLASGTLSVVAEAGQTIAATASVSVTSLTILTNQTATYVPNAAANYTSDVHFRTDSESFLTLVENTYNEVAPGLTCSSGGSTATSYYISDYNGVTAPAWVVVDSTTGVLKFTTPAISSPTNYSFLVNTIVGTATVHVKKTIFLKVNPCSAAN